MYLFGWGHRTAQLGTAGMRHCTNCAQTRSVQTVLEYRYFHVFWIVGAILTRSYHFGCSGCGIEIQARDPKLRKAVRSGTARFVSFGPLFLIVLGGALVLIGPGDYSD